MSSNSDGPDLLASVFPETLLHFPDHGLVIDLRKTVDAAARHCFASIFASGGPEMSFCVITADNPNGVTQSDLENTAAFGKLRKAVAAMGVTSVPCDGTNAAQTHRERGLAAKVGRDQGIELGRAFEQIAIFHYDGDTFWLVPALAEGPARRLP
jgi:hypothetical protein